MCDDVKIETTKCEGEILRQDFVYTRQKIKCDKKGKATGFEEESFLEVCNGNSKIEQISRDFDKAMGW